MRMLPATIVTLLAIGAGQPAIAQGTPAAASAVTPAVTPTALPTHLQVGARVRAHAPALGPGFEGVVVGTSGDTLDLAGDGARVRLPMAAITALELHRGRSRGEGAKRGVMWGTAVGVALGGVTATMATAYEDECAAAYECRGDSGVNAQAVAGWIGWSALSGAIWGAAIGAIIGRDRWEGVPLSRVSARPVVAPGRGVGLRLSIATR